MVSQVDEMMAEMMESCKKMESIKVRLGNEEVTLDLSDIVEYSLAFAFGILDGMLNRCYTIKDLEKVGAESLLIMQEVITDGARAMEPRTSNDVPGYS